MSDLQGIFTGAVAAVETRARGLDESLLWPEEGAALGEVVDGRRWDWVMGRRCAREAMERLGVQPVPLLSGDAREPLWPEGVVGAITHTRGYAAAAVARKGEVRAIGIDAEPDEPLPEGVLRRVSVASERSWIESGHDLGVAHPDRLLFSVKESIYKAWYPMARSWLGFEDARVRVDAASQTFEAEILVEGPFAGVQGRYGAVDGLLLTAIELYH
ncbi:MAG: 4'-phosphopantetheinyl transferase [Acidimicrobiales bacterium]